jgi:hypothetical protein
MCVADWSKPEFPLHIERRERPRTEGLIEGFFTVTYNSLRKHMPEAMEEQREAA